MPSRYTPVGRTTITRLSKELDQIITRAEAPQDLELRSDLARYACLRLAGFLEQALLSYGRSLVASRSGGQARSFAESHLEKSFNPTRDAVEKFVGRFDSHWRKAVEVLLAESERGQTINALVGIRNQIAHGGSQGVSIERVKDYRAVVDELLRFLLDRFDPPPAPAP